MANTYWAGVMLSYAARPPDPEVVGNGWAEIWKERLEAEPFLLDIWLRHQRRDDYWRHGSICEDWGAIECPVWVIAGWADGYRNCPPTLAANLKAPVKAMVGPWIHKYPHFAWPQPRADFLRMAVDWWRQWLAGEERGIAEWPDYTAYMLEGVRPAPRREADPGRWIATGWPGRGGRTAMPLGADGVLGSPEPGEVVVASPQHCGTMAGEYFTLAPGADLAGDQRADDGLSVCWEMAVLERPMEILGRPSLTLPVAIDREQGNLIARLVDVHPDGTAALIARGMLNLCHRGGNAEPVPVQPGREEAVTLWLDETAYRLREGHRLRLALSTTYWPMIQPSPAAVTATIAAGPEALLHLPHPGEVRELEVPAPPEDTLPTYPRLTEGRSRREVLHDLEAGRVRYTISEDSGLTEVPRNGMQTRETRDETWDVDPADPLSSKGGLVFTALRQRGAWQARTEARIAFSATATTFDVTAGLAAWDGETEVVRREWAFSIPRDHI
jgi:predicted acyl esterase